MRKLLKNNAVQSLIASLICILLGLLIGYIVLLFINPAGASKAIMDIIKNFFNYSRSNLQLKHFGTTLVKTAPLLMCALSVLFAYKVGLFNIGVAGQYVAGACASIYAALAWGWSWLPCMLFAALAGAVLGFIVGLLKAYRNVNEVISGIMLNWIGLYTTNMLLSKVQETGGNHTRDMTSAAHSAILPSIGLDKLLNNRFITIAIPLSVLFALLVWVILEKTKLGYELKATGFNRNAAKYSGMAEHRNIILTLMMAGALAGLGASLFYQTGHEQWTCTASSVPNMGFNGIAATFLGGLNPIGTIFSSFFIQHITEGGAHLDLKLYSPQISSLISSIIIYLCGFVLFMKHAMTNAINKREEKERRAKQAAEQGANEKGGEA